MSPVRKISPPLNKIDADEEHGEILRDADVRFVAAKEEIQPQAGARRKTGPTADHAVRHEAMRMIREWAW